MAAYSLLLYKDNHAFRFAQASLGAVSLANLVVYTIITVRSTSIDPLLAGKIVYIIPIVLGILMYTRISKEYSWMSRYGISVFIGTGLGIAARGIMETQILGQIKANALPIIGGQIYPFDNIVIIASTFFVLTYFFFTIKPTGTTKSVFDTSSKIGRYALMIAFGAIFGNVILTRVSWLAGRIGFIVDTLMKIFVTG
jgi:hypothetical protein